MHADTELAAVREPSTSRQLPRVPLLTQEGSGRNACQDWADCRIPGLPLALPTFHQGRWASLLNAAVEVANSLADRKIDRSSM